jgi:hypothetical protein
MRLALLALGLAGCNVVFALDSTTLEPAPDASLDDDQDGVVDARDNCPAVNNPDQLDGDGDGIGDACDPCDHCLPCAVGPSHDEDGDLVMDGCDNCPAIANSSQLNSDGDDLGDVCDADASQQHRLLFWGFSSLQDWLPPTDWRIVGDSAIPDPAVTQVARLTRFGTGLQQGIPWTFEVGLVLPPTPPDGKFVGTRPVSDTGIGSFVSCALFASGGAWTLSAGSTPVPTTTQAPVVLRMQGTGSNGVDASTCTIVGGGMTDAMQTALAYPLFPQLYTDAGAAVRYIDVIQ